MDDPSQNMGNFVPRTKKTAAKSVMGAGVSPRKPDVVTYDENEIATTTAAAITNVNDIFEDDDGDLPPARPVSTLHKSPTTNLPTLESSVSKKRKVAGSSQPRKKLSTKETTVAPKNGFWEIESILDVRKSGKSSFEFLVNWVGDYEPTWEPRKNLNKSALIDAQPMIEKLLKQDEVAHDANVAQSES